MAAAEKKSKGKNKHKGVGGEKGLEDAISAMRSEVETRDKSGGGEGTGEGQGYGRGVGIDAVYMDKVKAIIQRNWSYSGRADRASLQAVVNITLDSNGKIVGYRLVSSSGDPTFDSTLTTAIGRSTDDLPPPPSADLQDLDITFYDTQ